MTYNLIILPAANLDIKEASVWYNKKSPGLSNRFLSAIKEIANTIQNNPLLFEVRYDNVRTALLKTFPYLIHFAIYDDIIVIKAVYHTSRNSEIWKSRD